MKQGETNNANVAKRSPCWRGAPGCPPRIGAPAPAARVRPEYLPCPPGNGTAPHRGAVLLHQTASNTPLAVCTARRRLIRLPRLRTDAPAGAQVAAGVVQALALSGHLQSPGLGRAQRSPTPSSPSARTQSPASPFGRPWLKPHPRSRVLGFARSPQPLRCRPKAAISASPHGTAPCRRHAARPDRRWCRRRPRISPHPTRRRPARRARRFRSAGALPW